MMIEHIERQWLSAYIDEALEPAQHQRVIQHLASCASCRDNLQQLQTLRYQLAQLQAVEVPAGLLADTLRRLPPAVPPRSGHGRLLRYASAAATVMLGVFLGSQLTANHQQSAGWAAVQVLGSMPPGSVYVVSPYSPVEVGR